MRTGKTAPRFSDLVDVIVKRIDWKNKKGWFWRINEDGTAIDAAPPGGGGMVIHDNAWHDPHFETISGSQVRVNAHEVKNVSSTVHPNANTHILAPAPHVGHEVIANKGAAFGYASLDENKKILLEQIPPLDYVGGMLKEVYDKNGDGIVDNAHIILGDTQYEWKMDERRRIHLEEV